MILRHRSFHDLARLARRLTLGQCVDIFHAFDHFAPDGVLIVEETCVVEADEELAVRAIRVLRPRHRADAADMRLAVEFLRQVGKLAAAHAGARRIAALRHEAGDHAVKHDAVVKAFLGERRDALDVQRGEIGTQADDDVAGRQRKREGFGHIVTPMVGFGGAIAGRGSQGTFKLSKSSLRGVAIGWRRH